MNTEERFLSGIDQYKSYYFLHIPKTGGTSLTSVLDRFFPVENIYPVQLWWNVGSIEQVKKQSFQLFRGHFGLGAQLLSSNQLQTWSMFRNPINMAHSTYQHIIRDKNTIKHHQVVSNQIGFEAFLEDRRLAHLASNRMVKAMSFGLNTTCIKNIPHINRDNFKLFRRHMNQKRKKLTKNQLLRAVKAQLDKLQWFGILEDFDFSIAMLCHQMCWPPIGKSPKLNTFSKEKTFTKEACTLIKELNDLDVAYYAHIKKVYEQRKADFLTVLGLSEDSNLSVVNQIIEENYQKNYIQNNNITLKNSQEYNFSDKLLGQNWHQREWHAEGQFYFRWTGPEEHASIDFWVVPNDYQIIVHIINAINYSALDSLKLQINEHDVEYQIKNGDGVYMLVIDAQEELINSNGLLRLTLSNVLTESHHICFNSNDSRKVGLALKKIDIIKKPNRV